MPGEWITTNGFDCVYYLSDGTQIDIAENDDETWSLLRSHSETGETFEQAGPDPMREPMMREARAIWKRLGLKTVPSADQRAAPWFRGEDYDYTGANERNRRRQFHPEAVVEPPPAPAPAVDNTVEMLNAMMTAAKLNALIKGIG